MTLTVVTAAPPTPNGDLHLGHVSGPYLGADLLVRAERAAGRPAVLVTGSDVNQSYTPVKARELGQDPWAMAAKYADDIDAVFRAAWIEPAACLRPQDEPRHRELVAEFVRTLHERGHLVERERPALHCRRCDRHLYEAYVAGGCPRCGVDSDGNSCEGCAWPNDCVDLVRPRCNHCGDPPVTRTVRQLVFPLAGVAGVLAERIGETRCGVAVDALRRQLLARPLPEVPVGHPTDWGLPVPVPGWTGHRVYVWVEMVPGYLAGIEAATGRPWRAVWDDPGTDVVQFFGFDNSWFHAVLHPALLLAYDPAIRLPAALVANEFLTLDGTKFSTSRGHAVWARELVERVGADATRLALAALRPEVGPTAFSEPALVTLRDELDAGWRPWLDGLRDRLAAAPGGEPDEHGERFLAEVDRVAADVARSWSWRSYSPARAVRLLSELVRLATDFRRSGARLGGPDPAGAAAEAAAARRLAVAAAPVVPGFAAEVWAALGEPAPPLAATVRIGAETRTVVGSVRCTDGADRWDEHDLGDGRWLAEEDGVLSLWRRVATPGPVPTTATVEQDGQVLTCVDRGTGRYERVGADRGPLEYAEFRAGGRHVAYERFGDGPVLVGTRLPGTPRWGADDGTG